MHQKSCTKCHAVLPLSDFHYDKREADGHRARCRACLNASRRKSVKVGSEIKIVGPRGKAEMPRPAIITDLISPDHFSKDRLATSLKLASPLKVATSSHQQDEVSILDQISKKYNAHFSLSVSKNGKTVLQIHCRPTLTFKAQTVADVLTQATTYQS